MPRRTDLHRILVIGSGPIIIGQAAEFDYSGTQATKALQGRGVRGHSHQLESGDDHDRSGVRGSDVHRAGDARVRRADHREGEARTRFCRRWAARRRSTSRWRWRESGALEKYGVELIGATARAIAIAEDRKLFGEAMAAHRARRRRRAASPRATTKPRRSSRRTGFPAIIRPSFTLGGTGGGIAYNREEFEQIVRSGLDLSPTTRCSSSGA